ncbi:MAG TPA: cupin domain-containing protein [Acidobacteriota bacterium]|nr:cupin domain-containing protein [Acidobacteriota bacterium]
MRVEKPWGYELIWARTDKYVGKILHIVEGTKLSLQYHEIKDETIYLQSGEMELVIEENGRRNSTILNPGDTRHIPPGTVHRMIARKTCDVIEVSTTELDDVVRLEDDYGRIDSEEGSE